MKVTLKEAIEIHAKALAKRHKHRAPREALLHAERLKRKDDHDGHHVWLQVADVATRILAEAAKDDQP